MCGGGIRIKPLPVIPTEDPEVAEAVEKEKELARRRKGLRSTIVTGSMGVPTQPTQKKTLLGGDR
jgi:hypothetical protein